MVATPMRPAEQRDDLVCVCGVYLAAVMGSHFVLQFESQISEA